MASKKAPRKERGPGDYTNIGQRGRRTGLILPPTGQRDEYGLEPFPAFSSPERLPVKINGTPKGSAHKSAEEIGDSTGVAQSPSLGPLDILGSAKSLRRSIPRSKSPRKSLISGSPRRSVGPLSPSKNRVNSSTPRSLSRQPPNRQLDFSKDVPKLLDVISPHRTLLDPFKSMSSGEKGKTKRIFNLSELNDDQGGSLDNDENDGGMTNGFGHSEYTTYNGDSKSVGNSAFDTAGLDEHVEQSIEYDDYNEFGDAAVSDIAPFESMSPPATSSLHAGRNGAEPLSPESETGSISFSASTGGQHGGRRQEATTEVYEDADVVPASSTKSKPRNKKRAPSDRVPDARRRTGSKVTTKAPSVQPISRMGARGTSAGPSSGRTHIVARSETPATDDGTYKTRSGRASYKPLATWRGEKAIFGQRTDRETPAPVTDIIRTEEVPIPVEPRRKPAVRKPTRKRKLEEIAEVPEEVEEREDTEEEELVPVDPWETETGIKYGMVMSWDQDAEKYDEESNQQTEIAYAANAVELKDITGADFKLSKTLTLNYFGCGLVRLPPRSVKRLKNSRKMQMVFFVHEGRVTVNVANEEFSIGKAGQWLVPRGNFYGIVNESYHKDATLFFAQGCEWSSKLARLEAQTEAATAAALEEAGGGEEWTGRARDYYS